jgi:hypothetical protein
MDNWNLETFTKNENEKELCLIHDYEANECESLDIRLNQQTIFPFMFRCVINIRGKWYNLTDGYKTLLETIDEMDKKTKEIKWNYEDETMDFVEILQD